MDASMLTREDRPTAKSMTTINNERICENYYYSVVMNRTRRTRTRSSPYSLGYYVGPVSRLDTGCESLLYIIIIYSIYLRSLDAIVRHRIQVAIQVSVGFLLIT